MNTKLITLGGIFSLLLGSMSPVPADDTLPPDTFSQQDSYRLQMQQQLQAMTPEERALYQSMNQLRTENHTRSQANGNRKGKGKGDGSGSGKKYRYGQNGGRSMGNRHSSF